METMAKVCLIFFLILVLFYFPLSLIVAVCVWFLSFWDTALFSFGVDVSSIWYKVIKLTAGVYSKADFQEDDLVLKDQMLVGAQHSSNKVSEFWYINMYFIIVFRVVKFYIQWVTCIFLHVGRLIVWCVVFVSNSLAR